MGAIANCIRRQKYTILALLDIYFELSLGIILVFEIGAFVF